MNDQLVAQAAHVNRITAEIIAISEQTTQIVAMGAIRIGGLLKQAKEMIAPGEWGSYVEQQVKFSHRTANNCMKLHTEWEQNPNSQALANFSYTKAVRLLSLPETEREEFIESHDVEGMSTRELEAAIKAQKAAEDEAGELREQLKIAQKSADDSKTAEKNAVKKVDKLTKERDNAVKEKKKIEDALHQLQSNPTLSQEQMDHIQSEAIEAATANAKAELQEQLRAAEKKLEDATTARVAAEKALRMSDPDAAAFNVLLVQIQESYNKLNGYRLKIMAKNDDLYARCTEAQKALLQTLIKVVQ